MERSDSIAHATPGLSFAEPAIATCPFAAYRQLQDSQRVYHDPQTGIYEVLGAAEIRQAAADTDTFTCLVSRQHGFDAEMREAIGRLYEGEGFPMIRTLLNNEGEDHKRLRGLVDRAFTVPRINALMPAIRAEVDQLMSACERQVEIEFMESFAIPLPLNIIADQLGVSRDDHEAFKAGSDAMIAVSDPLTPRDLVLGHVRAVIRMQHILAERIAQVRAEPDDTMLGVVAALEVDGAPLSIGLLVNLFQNILVAGNETTTSALGNALEYIIADPALAERLRTDPALVRNFVEETLRLRAPLQGFYRSTARDTELGGVAIPAGATVMLRWGAAGRDAAVYDAPEQLDLDRKAITQHMTFGHGVHFCIGNQLARAELRATFEAITQRWPNVQLAERPDAIQPLPAFFAHGPKRMYIKI